MATQAHSQNTTTQADDPAKRRLLARAVTANSIFCTTSGAVVGLAAGPLANICGIAGANVFFGMTGVPFLRVLGVVLVAYGLALYWLRSRGPLPMWAAVEVIALDVAWVALSWWVILANVWPLTTTGDIIVGALADIVLVFAVVQSWGLRRILRG